MAFVKRVHRWCHQVWSIWQFYSYFNFFFPIRSAMDVYVHLFLFRWSETGDYFAVDQARFLNSLDVVKHFQTIKFSSFIRQLNMYGFRKFYPNNHKQGGCTCECHRTSPFGYYRHDFFRRGDIDCLNQVTRQRRQSGVVTNGNVVFFSCPMKQF